MRAKKQPVNLNLFSMKFPVTAIASILHRASGFVLFLFIPFLLWIFSMSMTRDGFARLQSVQQCWVMRLLEWLLLSGLIYHVIAGIRHLCMDAGYFEGKDSGKFSALIVTLVSLVLILAVGGWLL